MNIIRFLGMVIFLGIGFSCKKTASRDGLADLNIINASVPSVYVYLTLQDSAFYRQQSLLTYESSMEYGVNSGLSPLTLLNSLDTITPILQTNLHLLPGGIYSLYLSGQYPAIDTLLLQDQLPVYTDSVVGIRFINLSVGSQPMSVILQGNSIAQTEFTGLGYKQISSFKSYPDTNGIASYNFEIHDQKSGDLLTTATWNFTFRKNNTFVICGSEDPSSPTPISIFQINNF